MYVIWMLVASVVILEGKTSNIYEKKSKEMVLCATVNNTAT